uniref:Integrase core domain containing protein n=1 Tax=Solanum tuberosum TaxID=4113 RepID=M1DAM0_SOLTU
MDRSVHLWFPSATKIVGPLIHERVSQTVEWDATPQLGIRKATLNFAAKFFWLLVHNRVSPTKTDNQLTWDRAVMVAILVAGVEIDFACMLLAEIHERPFKTSTTYPFLCLIFQLCRDSGVPIWHCDRLIHPTRALDIGLIRDEENVAAPRREPQVEAASMAPSSSRSTPQLGATVVPLARVQKLEAQMATLLHHIQSWMQKSIAESEARIERRMEGMMDWKVQSINKRLDAFELRVLERSALAIDLSSLQAELANLRTTLIPFLTPLHGTAEEGLEPTHAKDEELRQRMVHESVAKASSSAPVVEVSPVVRDIVSTTDGAMMDDVGTTEDDPTLVPTGSGKPVTPAHS